MVDINKAVTDWLLKCPEIEENDFFFQFLNAEDSNQGMVTTSNTVLKTDILGNKTAQYSFAIISYKQASPDAVTTNTENFTSFEQVKNIASWINAQEVAKNYPNISPAKVTNIVSPLDPNLSGIDTNKNARNPLIKYMAQIVMTYEF